MTGPDALVEAVARALHPCDAPACPAAATWRVQARAAIDTTLQLVAADLTTTARAHVAAGRGHMTWAECVARIERIARPATEEDPSP